MRACKEGAGPGTGCGSQGHRARGLHNIPGNHAQDVRDPNILPLPVDDAPRDAQDQQAGVRTRAVAPVAPGMKSAEAAACAQHVHAFYFFPQ